MKIESNICLIFALILSMSLIPLAGDAPAQVNEEQTAKKPAGLKFDPVEIPKDKFDEKVIAEQTATLEKMAKETDEDDVAGKQVLAMQFEKRAHLYMQAGKWKDAANDYHSAIEMQPDNTMHWMRRGILLHLDGQQMRLVELAQQMLEMFKETENPYNADRTAKMYWLPEEPIDGREDAEKLADMSLEYQDRAWGEYYPSTRAMGHYRYGEFEKAIKSVEESNRLNSGLPEPRKDLATTNEVLKAMSLFRLGKRAGAAKSMSDASKSLAAHFGNPEFTFADDAWHNWIVAKLLHDEACRMITAVAEKTGEQQGGVTEK